MKRYQRREPPVLVSHDLKHQFIVGNLLRIVLTLAFQLVRSAQHYLLNHSLPSQLPYTLLHLVARSRVYLCLSLHLHGSNALAPILHPKGTLK